MDGAGLGIRYRGIREARPIQCREAGSKERRRWTTATKAPMCGCCVIHIEVRVGRLQRTRWRCTDHPRWLIVGVLRRPRHVRPRGNEMAVNVLQGVVGHSRTRDGEGASDHKREVAHHKSRVMKSLDRTPLVRRGAARKALPTSGGETTALDRCGGSTPANTALAFSTSDLEHCVGSPG
jgi:hypothetical protein